MTDRAFEPSDYPLAERSADAVRGARGKTLEDLTLDAVMAGEVDIADLGITPEALRAQAQIARATGRDRLAANFERGAEMASLPQETVMAIYELLRPGRARDEAPLREWAVQLRERYGAPALAAFLDEAAEVYRRRGLYRQRY